MATDNGIKATIEKVESQYRDGSFSAVRVRLVAPAVELSERQIAARAFDLAASILRGWPEGERWTQPTVDAGLAFGLKVAATVTVELVDGTPADAERVFERVRRAVRHADAGTVVS